MRVTQLITVAGLVGLTTLVLPGTTSQATPATSSHTVQHLIFIDHTGPTSYNDIGKKGLSVGDVFSFSESVTQAGRRIGFAGGSCTEIRVTTTTNAQQCLVTASLRQGQFTLQGIASYAASAPNVGTVAYAITGGTGAYRAARGEVHVSPVSDTADRIVVDLITD